MDDVVHIHLIALILKKNNFSFNGGSYLKHQKHGTAKGTWMAPSFLPTSLWANYIEKNLLHWATHKPIIWWRYIDDIFTVSTHGKEKLIKFIDEINKYISHGYQIYCRVVSVVCYIP